jgi:hypothetical protein
MFHRSLLAVILALTVPSGWAQTTTATLYGTLTDPSGGAVPGARITLQNADTGASFTAESDNLGGFTSTFLPAGNYTITVEAAGFKRYSEVGVLLSAAQTLRRTFPMTLGQVSETISVTSEIPLIQTATSNQQIQFSPMQVRELPTGGRNWTNLLNQMPGVEVSSEGARLNGMPRNGFTFTVDGTDGEADPEQPAFGMSRGFGNIIRGISTEAIGEISVNKGIVPAEVNTSMGGNVNVTTRSGTNEFHGSAFHNYQSGGLNARNPFLASRAPLVFHQYGGSLGGPILKNKAFFFAVFEGYRQTQQGRVTANVPTPEFKARALTAQPGYKPFFDLFPNPTNPYPPNAINGFFEGLSAGTAADDHGVLRGDYSFTVTSRLSVRYTRGRPNRLLPTAIANNQRSFSGTQETGTASFFTGRAAWTAETRLGVNYNEVKRDDEIYNLGIAGIVGSLGFGTAGETVVLRGTTTTVEQIMAVGRGKHAFKFGGIVGFKRNTRENIEVPEFTYASEADFLANIPSNIRVTFGVREFLVSQWNTGFFFQDDWRVNSRLTLNIGMRYDYFSVPRERDGRLFNRDFPYGFGALRPADSVYLADRRGFAPRIGFAYQLDKEGKTVLRGGFGIMINRIPLEGIVQDLVANAADEPNRVELTRADAQRLGLRYPVTNAQVLPLVKGGSGTIFGNAFAADIRNPVSYQRTIGIQRQLGANHSIDVSYVGNRAGWIPLAFDWNQPDRLTGVRPNTGFGTFRFYQPSDSSNFNSLQTSFRGRLNRGLTYGVNYVWGRNMGYSNNGSLATSELSPQDIYDVGGDYGPAPGDNRHRFLTNFVAELPFRKLISGWGRAGTLLFGGWQLAGFFNAISGDALNVVQTSSYKSSRPDYIGGEPILADFRQTLQFLNPRAFVQVPVAPASGAPIRPGNVGRHALYGPNRVNLDLGVAKNLQFTERVNLQLRADLFNAFNHVNYGGVSLNIRNSNFGRLTAGSFRTMQLNMRLTF